MTCTYPVIVMYSSLATILNLTGSATVIGLRFFGLLVKQPHQDGEVLVGAEGTFGSLVIQGGNH